MREKVRSVLDDSSSFIGKLVGYVVLGLIVTSCAAVVIETEPELPAWGREWLRRFEFVCTIAFTIEYVLRLWSARSPVKKAFEPLVIIDLLAILPFYAAMLPGVFDLRFLRILRMLRILRVLKLHRYSSALSMLVEVIRACRHKLLAFFFIAAICLFLIGSLMYHVEPGHFRSIPHALWWAVVTLTTVGYGDIVPESTIGRAIAGVLMLLGISIIAIPTGIISSGLTEHFSNASGVRCPKCGLDAHDQDARFCKRCSGPLVDDDGRYSFLGIDDDDDEDDELPGAS